MIMILLVLIFIATRIASGAVIHEGFIDEVVTTTKAMSGTFAPNPRNSNRPMMILNAKNGQVHVLEDPDESSDSIKVLDLSDGKRICNNGERGLHTVIPSPNFVDNQYLYAFFTKYRQDCRESSKEGPFNVVTRFPMNPITLMLDFDKGTVIWRGPPMDERLHNGGAMAFGNDGKLYITTGDAGKRENAQPLNNVHGSIIRINEDGTVPGDNPFTEEYGYTNSYRCADYDGRVPDDAPDDAVCAEVWSNGLRNPFRIDMDPNEKEKVKFSFGVVGAQHIESIYYGGTDYKGTNYGWPMYEGVCTPGDILDCPENTDASITMPFHWYEHVSYEDGGCIGGMSHVPEGLWPSQYKYLFIDFILLRIYSLEQDRPDRACSDCFPPLPPTRNATFYRSTRKEGENVNEARMTEMWFGPYKDTQALYISKFGNLDTIIRIRYNGIMNKPPKPAFDFTFNGENVVDFDASKTTDPENDSLTYHWDFGDDTESLDMITSHEYTTPGEYTITLTVTDINGQAQQISKTTKIGQPPVVNIISPIENTTFSVGQILRLRGEAYDFLGNPIPENQLTWEVRQHHAQHFHPFLDVTTGNDFDLYPAPEPEDYLAATNSFLKVVLTATDEYGLTSTYFVDVKPLVVMVNVSTKPPFLDIVVDDYDIETPEVVTSWDGFNLPLRVNDQPPYFFRSWSDGAKVRTRTIPIASQNNTDIKIEAIFCMSVGTRCDTDADCCSGHCNGSNGICATMPITHFPTESPSFFPSNLQTVLPTGFPTKKPVSLSPSSPSTNIYLRPPIQVQQSATKPDLEIAMNGKNPILDIDSQKPLKDEFNDDVDSIPITIGLNVGKELDTTKIWLLSLSIIFALLLIACLWVCMKNLVREKSDKSYVDSVVESVYGKWPDQRSSDEENSSNVDEDEYFSQPQSKLKVTSTVSTEEMQHEYNINVSTISSSDGATERDLSLSFLIPNSVSPESRHINDAENSNQILTENDQAHSCAMSSLSPVTKQVLDRSENKTSPFFSEAATMPSTDENQLGKNLENRFDDASTSQSSIIRSTSTSVSSPQSIIHNKSLDLPLNISEPSFSLLIPHASVSEDSFLEDERNFENTTDASEALIDEYTRHKDYLTKSAGSNLSKESENSFIISDRLDEVAREVSLFLMDSSDIEEPLLALEKKKLGSQECMDLSNHNDDNLFVCQPEATNNEISDIEQSHSKEDTELEITAVNSSNVAEHISLCRSEAHDASLFATEKNSSPPKIAVQPIIIDDSDILDTVVTQFSMISTSSYIRLDNENLLSEASIADSKQNESNSNISEDSTQIIRKSTHNEGRSIFISPEAQRKEQSEKVTPETLSISYDVDSSIDTCISSYFCEPDTPPGFSSKLSTNQHSPSVDSSRLFQRSK